MVDQNIHIIETPPVSTVGRGGIEGVKVYSSLNEAVSVLEEMLYQQSLGNGHVWQYTLNGRKIHSVRVFLPVGTAWLVVPTMTRSEIQEVLDEVGAAGGGVFYFMEGEYLLGDPLLIRHSNIHIYGQNLNTVLKCNGDWRYAISKVGGGLLPIESRNSTDGEYAGVIDVRGTENNRIENIKISGIKIHGNKETCYSYGINLVYVGLAQTAGLMEGVSRFDSSTVGSDKPNKIGVKIQNCTVQNNSYRGIQLTYSANNTITGNTVQNNGDRGIYLNSSANNNTITGNTVQNNGSHGISLDSSTNNTITGNTVQNNGSRGIYLDSSSNNNTITGNTVQNNNSQGIYLGTSNNTITGNTVQNNGSDGICLNASANNNTITGNTVQNNSFGIYLYSSNNTITGNTVQNNSRGITLVSSANNTITGNIMVSNANSNIQINSGSNYNIICSNQHGNSITDSGSNNKVYNNK